ncbi:MAG: hypothetical protein HOD92_09985 [Deltaproteobacteria bacterium]|nr:hypothetical protein [Deltaproteobacteria bacterium]
MPIISRLFRYHLVIFSLMITLICSYSIDIFGDSFDRDFSDFDDFDTTIKPKKVRKKGFEKFMDDAVANLNMEFTYKAMGYSEKVPTETKEEEEFKDNDLRVFEETLSYETTVERGKHRFTTSGWFTFGTQEDTYLGMTDSFDEQERRRRNHEIDELYWLYEPGTLSTTIGKKVFKNGISTNFSPVDRISPVDWNDPLYPRQLGLWVLSANVPISDIDFSIAYFPWFTPSKYPSLKSRWTPSSNTIIRNRREAKSEFESGSDYEYVYPNPSDQYFTKLELTTDFGMDIYISYFQGVSPYPVLKTEEQDDGSNIYYIVHIPVTNTCAGFSTVYEKAEFHAEALTQLNRGEDKDDEYTSYIYGMILLLENVIITLDYTDEDISKEKPDNEYESSKEIRSRMHGWIATMTLEFTSFFNARIAFIANTEDDGEIHDVTMNWEATDRLKTSLKFQTFTGAEGSFFKEEWGYNDRIVFEMTYTFGGSDDS